MSEANQMDFFPTADEILNEVPITTCNECGEQFANSSACRFHIVKLHLKSETPSVNERRIIKRSPDTPRVVMAYHCPDPECLEAKKWYDGWRNLRQHYYRSHAEKSFACDLCGFKTGLEKDLNYHRKVRCSWMKKRKSDIEKTCTEETNIISKRRKKSKKSPNFQSENPEPDGNFERLPTTSSSDSSRPVIIVVAGESVNKVIAKIQRSLGDGTVLEFDSAEAGTQVQMPPYVEDDMVPMYNNNTSTTSFATQYEDPGATFCERGTMMNDQEFNHFSPPYGAEFGDIPPQPKDQQQFGYSVASTSTQPQTRNFGTMFEDVHKCNTGTSMIDEPYGSEFLRDIETQTPSYLIQDSSSTSSGGSSTAPSTSQNDWRWPS